MLDTLTSSPTHGPATPRLAWGLAGFVLLGVGYPILRALLPGPVRVAIMIPLGLLLLWLLWKLTAPRSPVQTSRPLGLALLLVSLSLALSSVFGIADPVTIAGTLFDWLQVAVLLFLTLDLIAAGVPPRRFLAALFLTVSAMLLAMLWALGGWFWQWWQLWQPGMAWLPVGWRKPVGSTHPNQIAIILNFGIPLAIAALWLARHTWQRWLLSAWLLFAVIAMFYTSSRGGWLGMAAVSAMLLFPLALSSLHQRAWRRLASLIGLSALYATVFLGLLLANLQQVEAARNLTPRQPTAAPTAAAPPLDRETVSRLTDSAGRQVFWRRAVEFFAERPVLGVGPEGYATRYATVEPHSRFFRAPHAHSIYFSILSEAGLLGIAALLALAGAAGMIWWRGWRTAEPLIRRDPAGTLHTPSDGRIVILAGAAVLVAVLAQGSVEVPTIDLIGIALIGATASLGAAGAWHSQPRGRLHRPTRPLWQRARAVHPLHLVIGVVAVLAWASAIGIFVQRTRYEQLLSQARQAAQLGDIAAATAIYRTALDRYAWGGAAASEYATALAWLAHADTTNLAALDAAIHAQGVAQQRDPTNRATPVNTAALHMAAGQPELAQAILTDFVATDRRWAAPQILLAQLAEDHGDAAQAEQHWRRAIALEPYIAASRACQASSLCAGLPLPTSEYAALVHARATLAQPQITPDAVAQMMADAQRWNSIDLWAVAALAAERANLPQARARALQAAQDLAETQSRQPTQQLALVQLQDAMQRNDEQAMRRLLEQWLLPPDMTLVPQLTQQIVRSTEQELAATLAQAAAQLGDAELQARAQAYLRRLTPRHA
ncbi:MAG: hypothetical protein HC911_16570 [Chloroflexaceae bacterium]|nr:hypothetical protein [Chloroflexaceae bacterium]